MDEGPSTTGTSWDDTLATLSPEAVSRLVERVLARPTSGGTPHVPHVLTATARDSLERLSSLRRALAGRALFVAVPAASDPLAAALEAGVRDLCRRASPGARAPVAALVDRLIEIGASFVLHEELAAVAPSLTPEALDAAGTLPAVLAERFVPGLATVVPGVSRDLFAALVAERGRAGDGAELARCARALGPSAFFHELASLSSRLGLPLVLAFEPSESCALVAAAAASLVRHPGLGLVVASVQSAWESQRALLHDEELELYESLAITRRFSRAKLAEPGAESAAAAPAAAAAPVAPAAAAPVAPAALVVTPVAPTPVAPTPVTPTPVTPTPVTPTPVTPTPLAPALAVPVAPAPVASATPAAAPAAREPAPAAPVAPGITAPAPKASSAVASPRSSAPVASTQPTTGESADRWIKLGLVGVVLLGIVATASVFVASAVARAHGSGRGDGVSPVASSTPAPPSKPVAAPVVSPSPGDPDLVELKAAKTTSERLAVIDRAVAKLPPERALGLMDVLLGPLERVAGASDLRRGLVARLVRVNHPGAVDRLLTIAETITAPVPERLEAVHGIEQRRELVTVAFRPRLERLAALDRDEGVRRQAKLVLGP